MKIFRSLTFSVFSLILSGGFLSWSGAQPDEQNTGTIENIRTAKKLAQDDPEAADRYARLALKGALMSGVDSLNAQANYVLGLINYYQSHFYLSSDFYQRALNTDYARANDLFASSCRNNLGINYETTDRYPEAMEEYLKSLRISEKLKDSLGIYQTYINLGFLHTKKREFDRAQSRLNAALSYFAAHNDKYNIALIYQNLGINSFQSGKPENALNYFILAEKLYGETDNTEGLIDMKINKAQSLMAAGSLSRAFAELKMAERLNAGKEDSYDGALLSVGLGEYYLKSKNYTGAEFYLLEAERKSRLLGEMFNLRNVYELKCALYAASGQVIKHQAALDSLRNIGYKIFNSESEARYAEFSTLYENERSVSKIKALADELHNKDQVARLWSLLAALFFAALISLILLNLRLRGKRRALFQKNMELSKLLDSMTFMVNTAEGDGTPETEDSFAALFWELNSLVKKEELYLNPDLSVNDLAWRLNTNEKYISKAISAGTGSNFSSYINSYRINRSRKMLNDPENSRLSIEQIANKSGFNNQHTFLRHFREYTGLTPSAFKKHKFSKLQEPARD